MIGPNSGGFIQRLAEHAHSFAQESASQSRRAAGEWAIWRRQIIGDRRPEADNAMGADMDGTTFRTVDHPIQISEGGTDHHGEKSFFVSAPCGQGDLILRKQGNPQTPEDAREADFSYVYRVKDYDLKHDSEGKLIYNKITVEPDRSGQW